MKPATAVTTPVRDDFLLRMGRWFYLLGVALIPLLNIRLIGESFTASDAALGLALLATLWSLGRTKKVPRAPILLVCFLIFMAGTAASTMAISPAGSELIVVRMLFIAGLWPWMTRHLITNADDLGRAVRLWLGTTVVFGMVSLIQTQKPSFLNAGSNGNGRVFGLAGHPTDAGGVLCIGLVTLAALSPQRKRWLVPWLFGIAAIGIGLVLSGSVSGFLATGIGLVVLFFRMRQGLGARLLTIAAVTGGSFMAIRVATSGAVNGASPTERFTHTTSGQYDTLAERIQTYHNGWQGIVHDPLIGKGMDAASGIVVQPDLAVHNMWLLAWYQGGILMLLAMVIFVVYVMRSGLARGAGSNKLLTALVAGAATAFAFSMTSPLLTQRYLWAPMVLLLATREILPLTSAPASSLAGADPPASLAGRR